ncbi:GNAT family N-acetyltransferase [Gramella sp. AN32]|uniref:GNAT family N-acetyltransferase n=1 Tax=Christiangramia antarctica TaxID=2058158 RepID=A0ABW5X187_9FLAO|nr:GNAT family N-acetyltransferase [Gramella sp. AN32]MCM4154930.1 GNAT family N-acetyltransferase [Gramella sp. AN32]
MIRLAKLSELDKIKELTERCAMHMINKKIFQWNENYPSRERLQEDILQNELWITEENFTILGIIVITPKMDYEYIPIKWLTKNGNNLYIHRLAVDPDLWGNGIAQNMMSFAENKARKENFDSVRLDTFSQNKRNQNFYESRGYQKLGNIYFPRQSEHPFYCYELPL